MRPPIISKPLNRGVTTNANCSHGRLCVVHDLDYIRLRRRGTSTIRRPRIVDLAEVGLPRAVGNRPSRQRKIRRSAFNATVID
jgi:hypothetical protein